MHVHISGYPGISRCHINFRDIGVLAKSPSDGMLASTGPKYKHLHVSDPIE